MRASESFFRSSVIYSLMQTTVTQKNPYTLTILAKESSTEFEKAKKHIIDTIRQEGKVKGFKKGSNIPEEIIMREFGEEAINQQAVDAIIQKIYPKILKKENIIPVAPGNITELKSTTPLEFTIEVEVFPEVVIDEKKLDTIKVKRTRVKVDKKEVEAELDAIKTRFTHFHEAGAHTDDGADTSNTTIEQGDRATISAQ